jgi:hypothetical protein
MYNNQKILMDIFKDLDITKLQNILIENIIGGQGWY